MNVADYSHSEENLRVVDTGKSAFKIVREAEGSGLWKIETDTGPLPVALRDKQYTRHIYAFQDIKNYVDQAPARQIIYAKKTKESPKED